MAVHSFASIDEIIHAATEEERETIRAKVLAESRDFDTHLRAAVTKKDANERNEALLKLESLYEFKRSHPTVEVRFFILKRFEPRDCLKLTCLTYQHFTPLLVAAAAAGDADVEALGVDLVDPGFSYLNLRFA